MGFDVSERERCPVPARSAGCRQKISCLWKSTRPCPGLPPFRPLIFASPVGSPAMHTPTSQPMPRTRRATPNSPAQHPSEEPPTPHRSTRWPTQPPQLQKHGFFGTLCPPEPHCRVAFPGVRRASLRPERPGIQRSGLRWVFLAGWGRCCAALYFPSLDGLGERVNASVFWEGGRVRCEVSGGGINGAALFPPVGTRSRGVCVRRVLCTCLSLDS